MGSMPSSPFHSRPWQSREDTRLIQDLVRDRLEHDWPAVRLHPGDVDWWAVGTFERVPGMEERVRLWFRGDAERPVAYGWFSPPSDLDFIASPRLARDQATLVGEVVDWADGKRLRFGNGGTAPLRAWASALDRDLAAALEASGLVAEDKPGYVHFTADLSIADRWPASTLPAGLVLRPLDPDADLPSRVECGRAAFTTSTMTEDRYRSTFDCWLYRPDLDRVAVTGDGRVVAFALGWLDPVTEVVELEPVGVHPEFHRRGLGAAVCRDALRAARELGARRAMIAAERRNPGAVGLYASLGLTTSADIVPYARPIRAAESGDPATS
jgi:ribosomal protein S18 acetylase RimI-like enzyme